MEFRALLMSRSLANSRPLSETRTEMDPSSPLDWSWVLGDIIRREHRTMKRIEENTIVLADGGAAISVRG